MKTYKIEGKKEGGFTLVELAIVMIIIGLLIGGILKGQQLIANAEIASTIALVKSVDTGMNTFRDAYAALPGDMANSAARIQNCVNACAVAGDANGQITPAPGAAQVDADNAEALAAWAQMAAADVMGGVNPTAEGDLGVVAGQSVPLASVGGTLKLGYSATGALTNDTAAANAAGGHYVLLSNATVGATATGDARLTQTQAARIDRKMDDGFPNSGSTVAMGTQGAANTCSDDDTNTAVYNEAANTVTCGLYFRVQS